MTAFNLSAQTSAYEDYVVLLNGDTVQCKIKHISPEYIAYDFNRDGVQVFKKTALKNILSWYAPSNIPEKVTPKISPRSNDSTRTVQLENLSKSPFPRYILSSNIGFGYRLAEIPEGVWGSTLQHLRQLSRGFCYGISVNHTGKKGHGIALNYGNMLIKANSLDYQYSAPGVLLQGKVNESINIHYLGISYEFLRKRKLKNRWFQHSIGVGWSAFREELTAARIFKVSGDAISLNYATNYMFSLNKSMFLGIHSLANFGWINKFSFYDGLNRETISTDVKESLFRLQIGVSFNYLIFREE